MSAFPASNSSKPAFIDPATFTPHFSWKTAPGNAGHSRLVFCEGVPLVDVANRVGTPTYLYSRAAIEDAYQELHRGLRGVAHTVCFAVKSNSNLSILKHLAKIGSGFDVVSGGELLLLERIGVAGNRIVFSGVGKTQEEIRQALRYPMGNRGGNPGVLLYNVESEPELEILLEESARQKKRNGGVPSVSIRINPDVRAGGHPHISTGRHQHKFGVDWSEARRLYRAHRHSRWIRWQGISAHIGSQIVSLDPFRRSFERLKDYLKELRGDGIVLRYVDLGGGLGVRYTNERPPARQAYARMVAHMVRPLGLHLLLEPGRTIIAPAGVLLTRVLYVKQNRGRTFVVVDAAMNDLIRPALYGAIHPITNVSDQKNGAPKRRVDVVGPVCETGDCFIRDWPLGEVAAGDVLAIWVAGAYGMVQTSNYNARLRPAEVLVEGRNFRVIRRRESPRDFLRGQLPG